MGLGGGFGTKGLGPGLDNLFVTFMFELPEKVSVRVEAVANNVGKLESKPGYLSNLLMVNDQ